jgi:hypothetical protein
MGAAFAVKSEKDRRREPIFRAFDIAGPGQNEKDLGLRELQHLASLRCAGPLVLLCFIVVNTPLAFIE